LSRTNEQFGAALKARGGIALPADGPGGACSPARARQASVNEVTITRATAEALGVPFVETLSGRPVSHEFLTAVPIAFARRHSVLGLAGENGAMPVVLSDLAQWPHLQVLAKILGKRTLPLFAPRPERPEGRLQRRAPESASGRVRETEQRWYEQESRRHAERHQVETGCQRPLRQATRAAPEDRPRCNGTLSSGFQPLVAIGSLVAMARRRPRTASPSPVQALRRRTSRAAAPPISRKLSVAGSGTTTKGRIMSNSSCSRMWQWYT